MFFYAFLLVVHTLSAVIWLGFFPVEIVLRKTIKSEKMKSSTERIYSLEKKLISQFLFISNLTGMIGAIGILFTGVILVLYLPHYGFFNFSSNHWLATKQIFMVIILLIVILYLIPTAKRLRNSISEKVESENSVSEKIYSLLGKLNFYSTIVHLMVLINFLIAVTHRFFLM